MLVSQAILIAVLYIFAILYLMAILCSFFLCELILEILTCQSLLTLRRNLRLDRNFGRTAGKLRESFLGKLAILPEESNFGFFSGVI